MGALVARWLKRGGGIALLLGGALFLLGVREALGFAFAGLCAAALGYFLVDVMQGPDLDSDGGGSGDGGGEGGSSGDGGGE